MNSRLLVGLMAAICLFIQTCGKNPDIAEKVVVRLMEADSVVVKDSVVQDLDEMAAVDLGGGVEAVRMADFITTSQITAYIDKNSNSWDRRSLYCYRLIGSDNFSPHTRIDSTTGRPLNDLTWDQLQHGFIKVESRDAAYDGTLSFRGAYRVKDVAAIEIFRKIDVVIDSAGTRTIQQVRLAEKPRYPFPDTTSASSAKLSDILSMMAAPDSATVAGLDGYTGNRRYTLTQIQTGYWIVPLDQVKYSPDLGGSSRIKYADSIIVTKE